jgi:hypothetical protein
MFSVYQSKTTSVWYKLPQTQGPTNAPKEDLQNPPCDFDFSLFYKQWYRKATAGGGREELAVSVNAIK